MVYSQRLISPFQDGGRGRQVAPAGTCLLSSQRKTGKVSLDSRLLLYDLIFNQQSALLSVQAIHNNSWLIGKLPTSVNSGQGEKCCSIQSTEYFSAIALADQ